MWGDIAVIVVICVLMNHMGLIEAVEDTIGFKLPIVDCVKCSTFWAVLAYVQFADMRVTHGIAVSLLASYTAVWVDLLFGAVDCVYERIYNRLFN